MGERFTFLECHKIHNCLNGLKDGCQGFLPASNDSGKQSIFCDGCGCHRSFHRKVEVVYTICNKRHVFVSTLLTVDGCQEFTPRDEGSAVCICGCEKCFHRNENEITVVQTLPPSLES